MANVLGNILKDAGDIGKGVVNEVGEFGRRYRYGPYYKENQELAKQGALSGLEADRARKEYYEYLKTRAGKQQQFDIADINKTLDTLQTLKDNTDPANSEAIAVIDNLMKQAQAALAGMFPSGEMPPGIAGGINAVDQNVLARPAAVPQSSGASGGIKNWLTGLPNMPLGSSLTTGVPSASAVVPQGGGALGGMVGPPTPPDYNKYVPPGAQAKWSASTPVQRKAMMFAPTEGATIEDYATKAKQFIEPTSQIKTPEALSVTNVLDFYMPKLDRASQNELQQILASGDQNVINQALQRLREKYGNVR